MPKRAKTPSEKLQYLGNCIRTARNNCRLTQQELADQTGKGLRHLQNIEKGLINPSYEVLYALIHRLALSADILFYPEMAGQEEETRHLLNKFAACTEEERRFILNMVDYMVEQFIRRRYESSEGKAE